MGSATEAHPLHLVGKQPPAKLHSQMDHGRYAQSYKIKGHEPVEMHPDDAAARDLADGDIVRVYNARGSMLCGVCVTDSILKGVVAVSTGAWYDPLDPADPQSMCKHGNPNMVAPDQPTSRIGQGLPARIAALSRSRNIRARLSGSRRISHPRSNHADGVDVQTRLIAGRSLEIGDHFVRIGASTFHRRFDLFTSI